MLSNAARALGRISYSFYLFHFPILDLISLTMIGMFGAAYWQAYPIIGQLILFALAAPTTFFVASFAYRIIEAPGIAVGKWWLTRFSIRHTYRPEQPSRAGSGQTSDNRISLPSVGADYSLTAVQRPAQPSDRLNVPMPEIPES
jgi:peptidoglycan/LPS O-acetylase OafA/YrhL